MKKALQAAHQALAGTELDPAVRVMQQVKLQTLAARQAAFRIYSDAIGQPYELVLAAYTASAAADKADVEASLALERAILGTPTNQTVLTDLKATTTDLEQSANTLAAEAKKLAKFTQIANKLLGILKLVGV